MNLSLEPFVLSLQLAAWTTVVMLPVGFVLARLLAWGNFRGRLLLEAAVTLPLVLPPTVLGYYLLVFMSPQSVAGGWFESLFGYALTFSFPGLVLASMLFNLPFAVQPMQQAFAAIPTEVREAAWVSGLSNWRTIAIIELPLAWPGILGSAVLTFAHTLGEFGVVLMVGGNIPGETRTVAIAIYDHVQAFEMDAAAVLSGVLLVFALGAIMAVRALSGRGVRA
jgi:molybdate transport system permease protein